MGRPRRGQPQLLGDQGVCGMMPAPSIPAAGSQGRGSGGLRTWPDPSYFLDGGLRTWVQGKVDPKTNVVSWPGMLISTPFPCCFFSSLCHQPPLHAQRRGTRPAQAQGPASPVPGPEALLSYPSGRSVRHCRSVGGLAFPPPCPSSVPPDSPLPRCISRTNSP